MKVVRLSVLHTGHLYSPRRYPWYSFLLEAACGRKIKSKKNPSDPVGNRTRGLSGCSAVPQPNASLLAPVNVCICFKMLLLVTPHNPSES